MAIDLYDLYETFFLKKENNNVTLLHQRKIERSNFIQSPVWPWTQEMPTNSKTGSYRNVLSRKMLSVYRSSSASRALSFWQRWDLCYNKEERRSSFVCMCGSARGCANPPAGQRLWSFITRCTEECVGRQHSRLFSPQTAFCASNTPVRDKSHNAERSPLGGENFLRWAINQQLVISTTYSRLASYKWGNSCRQEPQGKQDVKISDGRIPSFSRLQLQQFLSPLKSPSHRVSVYCQVWCMAGFKYKLQAHVLLRLPVIL